jgi:hypothetical protein
MSLNSINQLILVMEKCCVLFEVGIEFFIAHSFSSICLLHFRSIVFPSLQRTFARKTSGHCLGTAITGECPPPPRQICTLPPLSLSLCRSVFVLEMIKLSSHILLGPPSGCFSRGFSNKTPSELQTQSIEASCLNNTTNHVWRLISSLRNIQICLTNMANNRTDSVMCR